MVGQLSVLECPVCGGEDFVITYCSGDVPASIMTLMGSAVDGKCDLCESELKDDGLLDYIEKNFEHWRVR